MAELAVMALTSAGVSAGTAATVGTVLSVGLTAASAFGSLQAGESQGASLDLQVRQSEANARAERLEGRRQALQIQDQLERDLASQNAIFAARGILEGEGSALAAKEEAEREATKQIDTARFNTDIQALNAENRASISRADADSARTQGQFDALNTLASFKPVSKVPGVGKKPPIPKRKPTLLSGL